jgi:GT2 family glycosyltransferase
LRGEWQFIQALSLGSNVPPRQACDVNGSRPAETVKGENGKSANTGEASETGTERGQGQLLNCLCYDFLRAVDCTIPRPRCKARLPPTLSVFLASPPSRFESSRALLAEWSAAARLLGDVELLHTRHFDQALSLATAPAFAWLNIGAPAHDTLASARRSLALMKQCGAAAAALSATTPRLSLTAIRHDATAPAPGTPVLIPSAGAAVFDRASLSALAAELPMAATFGDTDLGWRMALRGLTVIQAEPMARHTPPSRRSPIEQARLIRQATLNQLRVLFTCAGEAWLGAALPAALARLLVLAAARARLDPRAFDFGAPAAPASVLPVASVAMLLAIEDFARDLPMLQLRRRYVQRTRTCEDRAIQPLFENVVVDEEWRRAAGEGADAMCRMLGLCRGGTGRAGAQGAQGATGATGATGAEGATGVSIVVLTQLGPRHLPACLDSLAALDYPADLVEVIVVDNASAVDPTGIVRQHYPGARVLRQDRNRGFCGGNNAGAAAARHEWILFLNDDTRVDPSLLQHLLETVRTRHARCVGALVVDWDGTRIDFGGGGMNFEARGFQHGVGDSDMERWAVERPLLFANGAALLVHRDAYAAAGGFPNAYFAYYEDLALGWALWLSGEEVWLSPRARVRHRHHGTSSRSSSAARVRNCERNALYTLLTHIDHDGLGDVLSASLILAATRVVLGLGLGGFRADTLAGDDERRLRVSDRWSPRVLADHTKAELLRHGAARRHGLLGSARRVGLRGAAGTLRSLSHVVRWGGPPPNGDPPETPETYPIGAAGAAALAAAAEWCANAARMELPRTRLQARRQRSDREIISRFGDNWLHAVPVDSSRQAEYEITHRAVADAFNLARFLAS